LTTVVDDNVARRGEAGDEGGFDFFHWKVFSRCMRMYARVTVLA
jgi:hypothetical protein